MKQKPDYNCEYVIVLGCQIRGDRITRSLKRRLDSAYDYACINTECKIIVSGGQGRGENKTEALAMYEYLCERGIDSDRIIMGLNVRRIFPMDGGEGHFIAKLQKKDGSIGKLPVLKQKKLDKVAEKFLNEQLNSLPAYYYIDKERVYGMDVPFVDFKKVKVLRQGVYLGDVVKNRFEPSHSFYMVADFDYKRKANVTLDEMDCFMHGEVLQKECEKGYVAVCYEGHPFGFGKSDGKQIKNKIPKGLRLLPNSHVNKD